MVRVLASHQCGPDLIPAWCYIWVEFVVGSRLASQSTLVPHLPPPQKPTSPNNSNSTRMEDLHEN